MQRVLPGEQPTELSLTHPIFHAFFDIPTLDFVACLRSRQTDFLRDVRERQIRPSRCSSSPTSTTMSSGYWRYSDTGFDTDQISRTKPLQAGSQLRYLRDDALSL